MIRLLLQPYYIAAYYLSWVWFGLGGLLLNLVCTALLPVPRRERFGRRVRATIRSMFVWWIKWLHACRVVKVSWVGFEQQTLKTGCIYVGNHPSLIDAPVVLSQLPDAICIFKSALARNPCIGPAARLAGYSSGDSGVDLIREAAAQVAAGRSLLIFPEGTRTTPGQPLNPLKPGFALIAQRAQVPIRFLMLRTSPDLVVRGRAWWKPPQLPGWIEITLHEEIPANSGQSASEITAHVQERLATLVRNASSFGPPCHARTPTSC